MKNISLVILLSCLAVLAGCKNRTRTQVPSEKTYEQAEAEFRASLTAQDTLTVLGMTNDFMDKLQRGEIDEAVKAIKVLEDNALFEPSDDYIEALAERFRQCPVRSYILDRYSFSTEGVNDVHYKFTFREPVAGIIPAYIGLMFNPVKVDGRWYLALKDGSQSSSDLAKENQIHPLSPAPLKMVSQLSPEE